jgi:cytochrome c oxidase subunit II
MDGDRGKKTIAQMVAVGIVASAIGIALGLAIDWFPVAGSKQAEKIDTLWDVLVVVSVPIFVLVTVVVLFAVKEFRMRPGQEEMDGPPIHGNTRLEVVWTTIPALILVSLCSYAYVTLRDIEKTPANAAQEMKVNVTGEQFTWTFEYKGPDGKPVNTSQLFVPVGRSVKFFVHSKDVIHDFWVPAWRAKIDAVPGITTSYRVTPIKTGTFPIVCAELCGLGHAFMRQTAHVLPQAKFDAWMAKVAAPAQPAAGGQAAAVDAKALFTKGNAAGATACGSCHTLADAGTAGQTGPDLDKVLAGKSPAFIKESIVDPNAEIAKGYGKDIMPANFKDVLTPAELDALVAYLAKVTTK